MLAILNTLHLLQEYWRPVHKLKPGLYYNI